MDEKTKARIMDGSKIRRVLNRLATEVIERNRNLKNLTLVGIRTRGIHLAHRLAKLIRDLEGVQVPVAVLDITPYRDDASSPAKQAPGKKGKVKFAVDKKDILLVDDVLMTGRTIRAAMEGLIDLGRPRSIQLLTFIDRGHRELPIRPDFIGKTLPTSRREKVHVRLKESDGTDEVLITEPVKLR